MQLQLVNGSIIEANLAGRVLRSLYNAATPI